MRRGEYRRDDATAAGPYRASQAARCTVEVDLGELAVRLMERAAGPSSNMVRGASSPAAGPRCSYAAPSVVSIPLTDDGQS